MPVAIFYFCGKRASNRYTRTLVSTRAATTVQILSSPASILIEAFRLGCCGSSALTFGSLVEQSKFAALVVGVDRLSGRNHPDDFAGRHPLNIVARMDAVLLGDHLGYCDWFCCEV